MTAPLRLLQPLDAGLVLYLPFWEGAGIVAGDVSPFGNNGQLQGTPTWVAGKMGGYALSFNPATPDWVDCGSSDRLDISAELSVESWIKTAASATQGIMEKNIGEDINKQYSMFLYPPNTIYFRVVKGGTLYDALADAYPTLNQWYHVVGRYDGSEVSIWVNGAKQAVTATVAAPLDSGVGTLQVGRNPGATYYFNGVIDEVRVYNRALTPAEIFEHYYRFAR